VGGTETACGGDRRYSLQVSRILHERRNSAGRPQISDAMQSSISAVGARLPDMKSQGSGPLPPHIVLRPVWRADRAETAWGGASLRHSTQDASRAKHWTAAGRMGRRQPAGGDGMERSAAAAGRVRCEVHLWDRTQPEHSKAQPPPLACAAVTGLVPQACMAERSRDISAWAPFRGGGRMRLNR